MTNPDSPTPISSAETELERAKLHGPDVRTIDALSATLERAVVAENDFIQVHHNCIAAREKADELERQLKLAREALKPLGKIPIPVNSHPTELHVSILRFADGSFGPITIADVKRAREALK